DGPLADRQNQTSVFGDTNELGRTQDVLSAAVPANQRFHSGDRLRAQVELRLIVKDELVMLQRLMQRSLECETFRRLSRQERRAELVAVSSRLFRLVQSRVGALQQRLRIVAVLRVEGDADAGGDVEFMAIDGDRLRHRLEDLAR